MVITVELLEDNKVSIAFEDQKVPYALADIVSALLMAIDRTLHIYFDACPPDDEDKADVYDSLVAMFNIMLSRNFPDIKPLAFELSDAAILYAQDCIIDEAAKKGVTFDEAIAQYEKKAQEYVNARKMS